MKAKKLKLLLKSINDIAKRDIKEIKGIRVTDVELSPGHPLILLPTGGKYCLPEVKTINKIITSIDPKEFIQEARKVNAQSGILILSAVPSPHNKNYLLVLVHTPYGCCAYDVMIMDETPINNLKDVTDKFPIEIEIPDELKDKYVVM
jgi:hypothetical protein